MLSEVIVEVGKGVKSLTLGDRVEMEPGIYCGRCDVCKSGTYYVGTCINKVQP